MNLPVRRRTRWEEGDSFRRKPKGSLVTELKHTRWSVDKSFHPPAVTYLPDFLTTEQIELVLRQYRIEEISSKLTANDLELEDPEIRSPSPEPVYDPKTCQRINTRPQRAKEKLNRERNICIEECLRLDPSYTPPADYKPPLASKKLYIPQFSEATPQSYVSLILGHRGRTQKALQQQTNCKIYIRGKGASRGKNYQFENEDEPMHILIQGHNEEDVEHCCEVLEPLLNGKLDDEDNREARLRLMQLGAEHRLAIGFKTEWCESCGEQGHKKYNCPNRPLVQRSEDSARRHKTVKEQLEEFNRETGAGLTLGGSELTSVEKTMPHTEVSRGEEELLPPGVD